MMWRDHLLHSHLSLKRLRAPALTCAHCHHMYAIGIDLKEQLDYFVARADLSMPPCMASVNHFDGVPHCWWCLEREGGTCVRPCQRAAARDMQDVITAVHMLQRGWVTTDPTLVPIPSGSDKSRYNQSYGKVVRQVLHMPFGGHNKKRAPRQRAKKEVGRCAGTCSPPCASWRGDAAGLPSTDSTSQKPMRSSLTVRFEDGADSA